MIMAVLASCTIPPFDNGETEKPEVIETGDGTESEGVVESDGDTTASVTDPEDETDPKDETDPSVETDPAEDSDTAGETDSDTTEGENDTAGESDTVIEDEDGDLSEPEINYGTRENPVTTTYAHNVCGSLSNGESSLNPFYVMGTVTRIGETGSYYKNVYFTDGKTEMLIYTINMSNGITGFEVGDTITAYGYIKNYNGTIEMATYNGTVFVYVVDVIEDEDGDDNGGNTDSNHLYTDFTSDEKSLFNSTVGMVIPFIPNDEYYVEELSDEYGDYISFYTFGNTEAEFEAYRALFSSYTYVGTEDDSYGDAWYYYSKGDVCVDMSFYYYDGENVVDIYVYLSEDSGSTGGDSSDDDDDTTGDTINYGTRDNPVTTTYAYNACKDLANGDSSADAFYVKGTVTKIGQKGNYYMNVYFTDGKTEMLIYTINMSNGITGFEVGDTIIACGYIKNYNGTIEMATYNKTVYVYVVDVITDEDDNGSTGGDTPDDGGNTYTDFTSDEKELLNHEFGFVIPFIPNNGYTLEEYSYEDEIGYNFYTYGNTQAEFDAYLELFSSYTYDGTDTDDYGDAWYFYSYDGIYIDVSYYNTDEGYVTDVYVYITTDDGNNTPDDGGNGGNTGSDANLITNDGKGLPEDNDGVYDVDFTKGNYVQNVTDQGYYLDGCPTTGSPAVLVIPVEFSDVTAASKGYTIENLQKIFNGTGNDTTYYSVHDYFYISSYEKLDLDITVLDSWFRPEKNSSYYANATYDYYGDDIAIGDQLILDEALAYLATIMDLSKFDSDNNGVIDAVVMVNTLDIGEDDFQWAYRYWNIYTDDDGYYYEYDSVSANDYIWMCYEFMFESYDEETSDVNYDHSNPLNPYTFIHEFSHVLGADDYYDTDYQANPMGGLDMMDSMTGDHNPYTKFNYGWLTTSKLIVTNSSVTVTLDAFAKNGDTVILACNWDESLGAYQEYYVIMYYTATGLNSGEGGYFMRDGLVVYHVNSSLYAEDYDGETYYDVYNSNTSASSQNGTVDNLIEYVQSAEGNYTYVVGDSLPAVTDDNGNTLGYTFTVDALTADFATLTFTKK